MKKILNLGFLSVLFMLQSCEEKGVQIIFEPAEPLVDTTYMAAVETAQARNVFIEEFTGASCVNCPDGHATVAALIAANPGRVVAAAYHTFNGGNVFKPVHKLEGESAFDFRNTEATTMSTELYGGVNSIPTAGIDRIKLAAETKQISQISRTQWALQTENRLKIAAPANLTVTSSYNDAESKVSLKIRVAYTQNVTTKNAITIGVTESGIVDAQEYPDRIDMNYVHNHVFRKCFTPYDGNKILDSFSTKEAGRVYEYNYSFKPDISWKLENCHVIVVLSANDAGNKEVLQAAEVGIK